MKPIETPDGQFVDGTRRVPGTPVPAWWLNQQQAEPLNVIKAAGLEPDKDDDTQLLKAINKLAEAASQVSSIDALRKYPGNTGYVNVNGYYANTPGIGGGLFVANKSDTTSTDNGGTVIVSDNGTRWRRVFGVLSLYDFGYAAERDNAAATLEAVDKAVSGVDVDCCGLTINIASLQNYPKNNRYYNGKTQIDSYIMDFSHERPRTGNGRVLIGDNAGGRLKIKESAKTGVVAIGNGAMHAMEQCAVGIAIGSNAQGNAVLSRDNIAIGEGAMENVQSATAAYDQNNMGGTRNIAVGSNALLFLTSGQGNIAVGRNAAQSVDSTSDNVIIGRNALSGIAPVGSSGKIENFYPSKASGMTIVGANAASAYIGNSPVTAVGNLAINKIKTAKQVTAIGSAALQNLDAQLADNGGAVIWRGTQSATYNQSGTKLTITAPDLHGSAPGMVVGIRLIDGDARTLQNDVVPFIVDSVSSNSIVLTSKSSFDNASGSAEIRYLYGQAATRSISEAVTAIGDNAATSAQQAVGCSVVGTDALREGTEHDSVVAVGNSALRSGNHKSTVSIGSWSGASVESENCVFVGNAAGYKLIGNITPKSKMINSIAIGNMARVGGNNEIQIGNDGQTLYAPTGINIRSDLRDKADVAPLDVGLDFVKKLRPISGVYDRRDDYVDELFTDLPPDERAQKLREWWENPLKDGRHKQNKRQFWFGAQDLAAPENEFGKLPLHQARRWCLTLSLPHGHYRQQRRKRGRPTIPPPRRF